MNIGLLNYTFLSYMNKFHLPFTVLKQFTENYSKHPLFLLPDEYQSITATYCSSMIHFNMGTGRVN